MIQSEDLNLFSKKNFKIVSKRKPNTKEMKNLVFVNDALFGGGAEKSMRILLDNLPKKKDVNYHLIILESYDEYKIIKWCKKRNIRLILLSKL